jgi:hypothetical protein
LPQEFDEKQIPVLIPEKAGENKRGRKGAGWYVFGALPEAPSGDPQPLPQKPQDLFATFGAIPGNPDRLAQSYTIKTYVLEISSFFFLFAGIGINLFFIALIISVLL